MLCSDVAYPGGFEPLAFGVGVQRSIQLSYGYIFGFSRHADTPERLPRNVNKYTINPSQVK